MAEDISTPDAGATTGSNNGAGKSLEGAGLATGLSSLVNSVTGAVSSFFSKMTAKQAPVNNPLHQYATYDYVLGIACLSDYQLAYPDKSYMKNIRLPLICKSANADPKNRVKTAFGSFDFFIDKLEIDSTVGLEKNNNTNMLKMTFDITEPHSMGMFMVAMQQAAWNAGHENYLDAPYLLTIDFRGNTETGSMVTVPNTSRRIPFKFMTAEMDVTERGSVYHCTAAAYDKFAHTTDVAELKTDISIKGKTVQEILQTGEKSLQAVINKRLQQLKTDGIVEYPDEVVITFPNRVETAASQQVQNGADISKPAAVQAGTGSVDQLSSIFGTTRSTVNKTLIQTEAACNLLGKASGGITEARAGSVPFGSDKDVYDPTIKSMVRAKNMIDPKTGDYRFSQNSSIVNVINQVLLSSDYVKTALSYENITSDGYRTWWRIDTKIYNVSTDANFKSTGTKPRLIVYEVVPYRVHMSKFTPPSTKAPGFDELKKNVAKVYNYIFTGKNYDILQLNLNFKIGFSNVMPSSKLVRGIDSQRSGADSDTKEQRDNNEPMPEGKAPSRIPGAIHTKVKYVANYVGTENKGGGILEDASTRAARMFHNSITTGADVLNLEMKILGDPYYINQSGQGNYTAKPLSRNLNTDGSINYQDGEVDILVNFKTPVDLNQSSGLYDFGKSSKSAQVLQWSGVYQLIRIVSNFNGGQFTQTLHGSRRANQEIKDPAVREDMYNTGRMAKLEVPNNGDGEG